MHIEAIPLLRDNYAWLLTEGTEAVVIDPSEGPPLLELLAARGLLLRAILLTHHHHDHIGGVASLASAYRSAEVLCSAHDVPRIAGSTRAVRDGDTVALLGAQLRVLATPGHTLGAVCYEWAGGDAVFTGDTLFLSGCGRLFEGTTEMMWASLLRLRALPPTTRVYCGHEYTQKNLAFAVHTLAEPAARARLAEVEQRRAAGEITVPALLATELATNPFLRADVPTVMQMLGTTTPLATFTELRRRRDGF